MTLEKKITIHAREGYLIKKSELSNACVEDIKKKYTLMFYEEAACKKCEFLEDRHSDVCNNCAAFLGGVAMAKDIKVGNNSYLSTPIGDGKGLKSVLVKHGLNNFKLKKHFTSTEFKKPILFTGKLRDYQQGAVDAIISKKRGVVHLQPRAGKCIVGSSLVMTETGLQPIKNLFNNYNLSKTQETVIPVTNNNIASVSGEKEIFYLYSKMVDSTIKINTYDGYNVQGTNNHKVLILQDQLKFKWVRLDEIKVGDFMAVSRKKQWLASGNNLYDYKFDYRTINDNHKQQTLPSKMTTHLARLLGYWVANGNLNTIGRLNICSNNPKILEDFAYCCSKVFPELTTRIAYKQENNKEVGYVFAHSRQIYKFLQDACGLICGVAKTKEIPDVLMNTDSKFILAFIGSYLSCDAWLHNNGIEMCSASKNLINQLHVVLTFFGIVGRTRIKESYARNGTGIVRNYYYIDLHRNEAYKLLKLVDINKEYSMSDRYYINSADIVPFLKSTIHYTRTKYSASTGYWMHNNKLYSKRLKGKLLPDKTKGLNNGMHYDRTKINSINLKLLKWLDVAVYNKLKKVTNSNFYWTPVTSIKVINKPIRVYDVCVPKGHHFIANGLVNHNTVLSTAAICTIGKKTIILASQVDWLQGFYETFVGSKTQTALTNANKEQIGFAKTYEDFLKYDVCLSTIQTFYSEGGKKLLNKIKSLFSVVIIDEVHKSAADGFASALSKFSAEIICGLTGTFDRKDGRVKISANLLGPIIFEIAIERLKPTIRLVRTEYKKSYKGQMPWVNIVKALEFDPKRLKLIAEWAIKDAADGHMVIIPLTLVKSIEELIKLINKMSGKTLAYPFYGGAFAGKNKDKRDQTIEDARNYKIKIIVGNAKMLSTGINIPRASMIYDVSPSSNIPAATQRVSRILTPFEGKIPPVLRIFLDDFSIRKNCLRNEYYQCFKKVFNCIISEKDNEVLKNYFKSKSAKMDEFPIF